MNTWHVPARFAQPAIAALTPFLFLLPFANKAYHIDDPVYIWVAQQISVEPFDYFGFDFFWGSPSPRLVYQENRNPPGVSYLWAAAASVFGWSEVPMHVSAATLAALASLGTYFLARRFTCLPLIAVFIAVIGPGFMVSANTVMSDAPMLAAYVWAVLLWLKGLESGKYTMLVAGATLVGLAALTKYFAITALPLLCLFTASKHRGVNKRLLYFLIPISILIIYEVYNKQLYGELLFAAASKHATTYPDDLPFIHRTSVALAFVGGSWPAFLFYSPMFWRRGMLIGAGLMLAIAAWLMRYEFFCHVPIRADEHLNWWFPLQFSLWLVTGLSIAILVLQDLFRRRDPESLLLVTWCIGTFLFCAYLNWTINVRAVLAMAPALGIIAARRLEDSWPKEGLLRWRKHITPLAASALLSVMVMYADFRLANSAREAAAKFAADADKHGHAYHYEAAWGFQFYMDQAGLSAFDDRKTYAPGERVVVPKHNVAKHSFDPDVTRVVEGAGIKMTAFPWISTMNRKAGAGFYSHFASCLPFAFAPVDDEEYTVVEYVPSNR